MNIHNSTYDELKKYYDITLNKNKELFETPNDEPTPIGCIEEMLEKVPLELWKRENLKILDPCGGTGNFHLVNHNLIKKYNPNKTTSSIINNNLFYNDINQKRINITKSIFPQLSITNIDFLKYPDIKDEEDKYDLITVNPPYALLKYDELTKTWKRTSKNHNLIKPFIKKSLDLLKKGGYIVFITPNNWMSLADRNTIIRHLTKLQFHWLDIGSAKKKWFSHIGSSFTWYIIENTPYYKDFIVSGEYKGIKYNNKVKSQIRDYIPLIYNNIIQNILNKVIDNNLPKYTIETSSDLHKYTKKDDISSIKNDIFKYKLIHTPRQIVYSKRPHKYQDGYKVFISTTTYYEVFVDKCGMTQSISFIKCKNLQEANDIKEILNNDLFKFINNICRWGNFNCIRILQKFPIVDPNRNIYEQFDLTNNEIEFIKKFQNK